MNYTKQIAGSVVASIIVVAAAFALYHPAVVISQQPPTLVKGTSPEVDSPYIIIGGVKQWYFSQSMKQPTTTTDTISPLCSFPYPVGTSTPEYVTWDITSGTSTQGEVDIATSTNACSTTTSGELSSNFNVPSSSSTAVYWTPSTGTNQNVNNASGTTYINIVAGGTGNTQGGYQYTGFCQAVFDSF
jgi:hypothetical protein